MAELQEACMRLAWKSLRLVELMSDIGSRCFGEGPRSTAAKMSFLMSSVTSFAFWDALILPASSTCTVRSEMAKARSSAPIH